MIRKLKLVGLLLLISMSFPPSQTLSQTSQAPPELAISQAAGDVRIAWSSTGLSSQAALSEQYGWQMQRYGAKLIPGRVISLRVEQALPPSPVISQLQSRTWQASLPNAPTIVPQTSTGELRPDLAAPLQTSLPSSPISLLREGTIRGQRLAVFLISPLIQVGDQIALVEELDAHISGAQLIETDLNELLASEGPFISAASGPSNPLAKSQGFKLAVANVGMQIVSGNMLAAAGVNLADVKRLQLYYRGQVVAMELRDGGDGRFDPEDTLRFFSAQVGDRWNSVEWYWLRVEANPGLRMSTRAAQPGNAPLRTSAFQSGKWREFVIYDSLLASPDGDHWFGRDLRTIPNEGHRSFNILAQGTLPLAKTGSSTITVRGAGYTNQSHQITLGDAEMKLFLPLVAKENNSPSDPAPEVPAKPQRTITPAVASWQKTGDFSHSFSASPPMNFIKVTSLSGSTPSGLGFSSILWRQPVELDFSFQGGLFETEAGTWQYALRNTPSQRTLYDVSDPNRPVILNIPDGQNPRFQDGNAARTYLLSGPNLEHQPQIFKHTPADLSPALNADAIYITPAAFQSALQPLLTLRQSQGYVARAVDVQAIYDNWSFGAVDPKAIHAFLRYAAATWARTPKAVGLVGDGTLDPFNYTKTSLNGQVYNLNLIPPYLAMVDAWAGETACDSCYVQLDSEDPLDDLLPDLMIGRLPVKSADELTALITKISRYETEALNQAWRAKAIFLADNYLQVDGTPDPGGDFAALADTGITLLPNTSTIERVYYDPAVTHVSAPWREPNAQKAKERSFAALKSGAGLLSFYGHSNQFQMAATDISNGRSNGLLTLYDPDLAQNGTKLPLVMQMTCLTSAFHSPTNSGTTIDERFVLSPDGGAIAVWGSSGLGVGYGHELLQEGFLKQLWSGSSPTVSQRVGALALAGSLKLFNDGTCCQSSVQTYLILGDPLTNIRLLRKAP
jgi:hypothetical protein